MNKKTNNKRLLATLLAILMVVIQLNLNGEVALATETLESSTSVESNDTAESSDFVGEEPVSATDSSDTDITVPDTDLAESNETTTSENSTETEENDDTLVESSKEDKLEETSDTTEVDDEYTPSQSEDSEYNESDEIESEEDDELHEELETVPPMSSDNGITALADQLAPIVVPDVPAPTSYTEVYERIIAWQEKIPTGTAWDDDSPYGNKGYLGKYYLWKGGNIDGARPLAVGCVAFAFILSDAAFGNLPATKINRGNFKFEDVRVGDILRVNNNSHSVIVLQTTPTGVIIAEGNNSGKVFWGRSMSKQDVMYADFILTRYPKGFVSDDEEDAKEIVDQGTEGNFTWTLTKNGILTISGKGAIPNFSVNDDYMPSWSKTTYPVSSIVIESGITSIGDYAFYQSPTLSVDIPSTITQIGDNAFMKSNLIGVSIPGSVTTIGYQAFRDCANLASLTFADGTTTIGDSAFRGCTEISGILNIPASVTTVGSNAFLSCMELMSIQFESSSHAVTIGANAFTQCWKMLSIKLPNNLTEISNGLFQSCAMLGYLYIPASVESIDLGMVGRDSPFLSSAIIQIDFGGSEAQWKAIGGNTALSNAQKLGSVTVNFNVPSTTTPSEPDKPTYTVTFNNDGTKTTATTDESKSYKVELPEVPSKEGYKFVGWFSENEEFTAETVVNSDIEVTAEYELITYTVTFNNEGAKTTATTDITKDYKVSLPEAPSKEGYKFLGWFNETEEFTAETVVKNDVEVSAKFEEITSNPDKPTYTVTFNNEGTKTTATTDIAKDYKVSLPKSPSKKGYEFLGWFNGTEEFTAETVVKSDVEVTAKYKIITYTVTFNNEGTKTTATTDITKDYKVSLPKSPSQKGYEFLGWFNGTEEFTAETVVKSDVEVMAKYKIITYTVTFNNEGTKTTATTDITKDYKVSLPETPSQKGYEFLGWFNGTEEFTAETVVKSDVEVTAKYKIITYTVTFNNEGTKTTATTDITKDYKVSLPKSPSQKGYEFLGWFNGTEEFTAETVVKSDVEVTAKYKIITYTVTFNNEGTKTTATTDITKGYKVSLPKSPSKKGYKFLGWFNGKEKFTAETVVKSDIEVTAKFKVLNTPNPDDSGNSGKDDNPTTPGTTTPSKPNESNTSDNSNKNDNPTNPGTTIPPRSNQSNPSDNLGKNDNPIKPINTTLSWPNVLNHLDNLGKDNNPTKPETTGLSKPNESNDSGISANASSQNSSNRSQLIPDSSVSSVSTQDENVSETDVNANADNSDSSATELSSTMVDSDYEELTIEDGAELRDDTTDESEKSDSRTLPIGGVIVAVMIVALAIFSGLFLVWKDISSSEK